MACRWQGSPGNANGLQGGSRSVTCALCPVMHGAFRQSLDGRDWIHQVSWPSSSGKLTSSCGWCRTLFRKVKPVGENLCIDGKAF